MLTRSVLLLCLSLISYNPAPIAANELTGGRADQESCAAAIAGAASAEANKPGWWKRHPRIRRTAQVLGLGTLGLIVTGAPVYPGDYVSRSPLLTMYQRVSDSSAYQGRNNAQQLIYLESMSRQWIKDGTPYIPPEILEGFNSLGEKENSLRTRTPETRAQHYQVLQKYQPIIFQDRVPTDEISPLRDTPVHPTIKMDNGVDPMPAIFGHIRETETHYFAIYTLFYFENNFEGAHVSALQKISGGAIPKPTKFNHPFDLETIVMAIRKNPSNPNHESVEAIFTHRHGMMHPHANSPLEAHMRNQLTPMLSGNFIKGDKSGIAFGPFFQPNAIHHDVTNEAVHFGAESGNVLRGPRIFSARMGHATYPVSMDAWRNGHGNGTIYVPEQASFNLDNVDLSHGARGVAPMRLFDWDDFLQAHRGNPSVFAGQQDPFELSTSQGLVTARQGNPNHWAPPPGMDPKTNVASGSRGRGPFPWAVPDANYRALTEGFPNFGPISDVYIYNPDIEIK